jgi:hypothetical protein
VTQRPSDPHGSEGRSPPHPYSHPGPVPGPRPMPRSVRAAQFLLAVYASLAAVGTVVLIAIAATAEAPETIEALGGYSPAAFYLLLAAVTAAFSVAQFIVAGRFLRGGNGTRVLAAVFGALIALVSAVALSTGSAVALLHLVGGVLILAFTCNGAALDWFDRVPGVSAPPAG